MMGQVHIHDRSEWIFASMIPIIIANRVNLWGKKLLFFGGEIESVFQKPNAMYVRIST